MTKTRSKVGEVARRPNNGMHPTPHQRLGGQASLDAEPAHNNYKAA